jgi:hypothetical protein
MSAAMPSLPKVAENATPASRDPARTVVRRLGGPKVVAAHLGLHPKRVSAWQRPRERGGCDGQIPQWHHPALLELAARRAVQLAPRELVQARRR